MVLLHLNEITSETVHEMHIKNGTFGNCYSGFENLRCKMLILYDYIIFDLTIQILFPKRLVKYGELGSWCQVLLKIMNISDLRLELNGEVQRMCHLRIGIVKNMSLQNF